MGLRVGQFSSGEWITFRAALTIGTLFLKIEFPVIRYNILNYVHVLSFYDAAKNDSRFLDAVDALVAKVSDGMLIVETTHKRLRDLVSCRVNERSEIATVYFNKIMDNLGRK